MVLEEGKSKALSLKGEVVEILEKEGERLARISVFSWNIIDVAGESIREAHLGDRVSIDAHVTIRCVKPE
jgi:predicted phosphatase